MSDLTHPAPARVRSRRLGTSALGLLAAAVLAIGVNMLADRLLPRARIDLTAQRLYTLSDGTRQVLAGLTDPITLRLFYSRKLGAEIPMYGAYADRVREMLSEYVSLSNGNVKLDADAKVGSASTVNGSLRVGDGANVTREASTVNGSIDVGKRAKIGGDVSTVSGDIDLNGAEVTGRLETRNGNIREALMERLFPEKEADRRV